MGKTTPPALGLAYAGLAFTKRRAPSFSRVRRRTSKVLCVYFRSVLEQEGGGFDGPERRARVERGAPGRVPGVDVGAVLQEEEHEVHTVRHAGPVERAAAELGVGGVDQVAQGLGGLFFSRRYFGNGPRRRARVKQKNAFVENPAARKREKVCLLFC